MQNGILGSGYTFYQVIWFFFIYAFVGWCGEVVFKSVRRGHFINSGFFNGPVCPIYGFGAISVILILHPIQNNIFLLFFGAVILTSALELATGYFLNVAFHTRWWDYSKQKFNLGGYICPLFSLVWGVACIFLIKVFQPIIVDFVNIIPHVVGIVLLIIFSALMITDWVTTTIEIHHMNKELKKASEISNKIHDTSDTIAKGLGNKAIEVSGKIQDLKDKEEQKQDEVIANNENVELKNTREKIMHNLAMKNAYTRKRLIKAFPDMKNTSSYNDELTELKNTVNQPKEKKKDKKTDK